MHYDLHKRCTLDFPKELFRRHGNQLDRCSNVDFGSIELSDRDYSSVVEEFETDSS